MRQGLARFLTVANVLLAAGLVVSALWLYGREHETRRLEREIRSLQRATLLEKETIRRLQIEWQRLRNPMRLEPLARERLRLLPPDPTAVLEQERALSMLPLRPPPVEDEAPAGQDALAGMAARAAEGGGEDASPDAATAAPGGQDALGSLIRGLMPQGEDRP